MSWSFGIGPVPRPLGVLIAGIGAGLTIFGLLKLHDSTLQAWLIPSFGASCALVFGVPDSPFARAGSVIGGHLVSSAVGLAAMALLGHGPMAMAVGVGCAIAAMMASRTMHPPAGGDPLIVMATAATPMFLLTPILLGASLICLAGILFNLFRQSQNIQNEPRQ